MTRPTDISLGGKTYKIKYVASKYSSDKTDVGYCDELARDLCPILFDSKDGNATKPFPPEAAYYRIYSKEEDLCVLYEIYWKEQICTGKDHKFDYEQVQVHMGLQGKITSVVVSAKGSPALSFHGVHVFLPRKGTNWYGTHYRTSPKESFPWGGEYGRSNVTEVFEFPIGDLKFLGSNPSLFVATCYHAFEGISPLAFERKKEFLESHRIPLKTKRLDDKVLDMWYNLNVENRFGHDISNPFESPFIKYHPPPDHHGSIVWIAIKRFFAAFWVSLTAR